MKARSRSWFILYFVLILFFLSAIVSCPTIPIKFHWKNINIDTELKGPDLDFTVLGRKIKKELNLKLGLDLQGGTHIALKADLSSVADDKKAEALESARTVIENRVNLFGVSEPNVYTAESGGEYRIIVELAGVKDVDSAVKLVGQTAKLEFGELSDEARKSDDALIRYYITSYVNTGISGSDLTGATVEFDPNTSAPIIQLNFSNEGRAKFSELAMRNVGQPIAIILDGYIISAPTISEDLANGVTGDPVINGNFTKEEAEALKTQLDAGALPVPVSVVEQRTIEATLGRESVQKSLLAGIVGIAIIMLFMVYNYGKLGLLADIALLMYTAFSLAIYKVGAPALILWVFTGELGEDVTVPITLTLAGIAGFILSIGVAVDANILIFERFKEELRWGKDKTEALKLGFDRAWTSIRDSNASTLITCIILGHFGTGAVKGFAVTLALGVLISLFTAVFVTRNMVTLFYKVKK